MNRIEQIFTELRSGGRRALMPFVCAGDPSLDSLGSILRGIQAGGGSIVEIGIPFSDPIADGPTISAAMQRALDRGVTPGAVFDAVAAVRGELSIGLVAMVSVSLIAAGSRTGEFVKRAADAGFDGFILPDVPVDEAERYTQIVRDAGMTASLLVAPTTPPERAARVVAASSGFVYLLARAGITGERSDLPDISAPVATLREASELPIACGFGIATAEQVGHVVHAADAAIVGSAMVRRLHEAAEAGRDPAAEAEAFTHELAGGLALSGPATV